MFPSPYGDFVFQQNFFPLFQRFLHGVSVPLRGFCFSTTRFLQLTTNAIMFPSPYGDFVFQRPASPPCSLLVGLCFRPLTGILFFNTNDAPTYAQEQLAFPSPYGDFVFQHKRIEGKVFHLSVMFPSPYGDFVFQLGGLAKLIKQNGVDVSVPLRGFCFSTRRRRRRKSRNRQ